MSVNLGVMQGRLSEPIGGRIQSFPEYSWQKEFDMAEKIGLNAIEWTIDLESFDRHPLINSNHKDAITQLLNRYQISCSTVTCDFFMQYTPWISTSSLSDLEARIETLISSKNLFGKKIMVIPLVDEGSPKSDAQWEYLRKMLLNFVPLLSKHDTEIAFEFDIPPEEQIVFLESLNSSRFGTNFDSGNSASLGFDSIFEIEVTKNFLKNVHVKEQYKEESKKTECFHDLALNVKTI
jgi:hexulose-6-phosphate isomerase